MAHIKLILINAMSVGESTKKKTIAIYQLSLFQQSEHYFAAL